MRVIRFAILATVATIAQSQQLIDSLPSCAQPCMTTAISDVGCDVSDKACICAANKVALLASSATCLLTECSPSDINTTKNQFTAFCAATASSTTRTHSPSMTKSSALATSTKPTTATTSSSSTTSTTSQPAASSASSETSQVAQLSATSASTTAPKASTITSTEAATAAPQIAGSGGLTAGAAAGVGIGVASVVIILALGVWLSLKRRQSSNKPRMHQDLETLNSFTTKRGYEMMPSNSNSTVTVEITAGNSTQMQELDSRIVPRPRAEDAIRTRVEAAPLSTRSFSSGREKSSETSNGSLAQNIEAVELDSRPITSASLPSNQVPSALVPAPWRWQHNHDLATDQPSR